MEAFRLEVRDLVPEDDRLLSVGLTGGVASGKSEALAAFGRLGAATLSSDVIVRELMRPGHPIVDRIRARFGPTAVRAGGGVCREVLRERVMADPAELDWLEKALHSEVRRAIRAFVAARRRKPGLVVVEVPLLFENGFDKLFDRTAAVKTTAVLSERRAVKRGMSPELYHFFLKRQWSPAKKAKAADAVIANNGDLKSLERRVAETHAKFCQQGLEKGGR